MYKDSDTDSDTEPFGAEETKEDACRVEETAVAEAPEPAWMSSLLSDEERQMVNNFVGQIDLDQFQCDFTVWRGNSEEDG